MNKITATIVTALAGTALLIPTAAQADNPTSLLNVLEDRIAQISDRNDCLEDQVDALRAQVRAAKREARGGPRFVQPSFVRSCR